MTGTTGALVVTLLVEVPIVAAMYRTPRSAALAFATNVFTNSALNRLWLVLVPWPVFALVSGELLSFAAEAFVYARLVRRDVDRALVASGAANLASFLAAPLVLDALR